MMRKWMIGIILVSALLASYANWAEAEEENESLEFRQLIIGTLEEMIKAYSSKDLTRFTEHISDSFQGDIFALEEAVQSDFRTYDDINLDISIEQVSKSEDQARVDFGFEWYGVKKIDGSIVNPSRGRTNYLFVQEAGEYKLLATASPIIFGVTEASEVDTGTQGE